MDKCSVRELGGEVFAELFRIQQDPEHPLAAMDWRHRQQVIDVVMGVLARHAGARLVNDEDLPVTPLPRGGE